MLNFKEYLTEIGDQSYKTTLERNFRHHSYIYTFKTDDGRPGDVYISIYEYDEDEDGEIYPSLWNVGFTINDVYDITGKGDAFKIFATVIECMKDWYKSEKPKGSVRLTAARDNGKESRIKLYRRMLDKFARQYQYEVLEQNEGSKVVFILYNLRDDYA